MYFSFPLIALYLTTQSLMASYVSFLTPNVKEIKNVDGLGI